jgi:hypothetical protein
VYIGLAFTAASTLLGHHREGGDQSARDWTAALLSEPFGRSLVAAVGVAFAIGGLAIARRGWTDCFDRLALSPDARHWAVPMGRVGFFARALVCLIVAGFLMLAALHANSSDARGLAGALKSLQQQPYGWALLGRLRSDFSLSERSSSSQPLTAALTPPALLKRLEGSRRAFGRLSASKPSRSLSRALVRAVLRISGGDRIPKARSA